MTNNNRNVSNKYEEERLRAAEQSQIVYLQGQIDELRRQLKDQSSKYSWAMEQVRKVEGSVSQIEGLIDRQRSEVLQALDASRREVTNLRKEVASAMVKIEEGVRPIRDMQAQIQLVAEARKQDRDYVAAWIVRSEEIEQRIVNWTSQLRDVDERHRSLLSRLDGFVAADEAVRAEVRKIAEELQIEKQSLRRQAIEAQQLITDLRPTIDSFTSRIDRLEEIRRQIDSFAEQIPGQIVELDQRIAEQVGELRRVERVATERFLMNQDRMEQVRQQQEEKIVHLQETDTLHLRQLTAWLERVDALLRELDQRQTRIGSRLEEVQRSHSTHLGDLEQRDVKLIETLMMALHTRVELIKAEQVERGRIPQEQGG
jgi:chromosome segregation ATPase